MKKIILTIISIAALTVACKPVEVRDQLKGNITVEELIANSTVTIETDGGQTVNKVICDTKAPVNAVWSNVTQFQGAHGELQLFGTGKQTIKLQGLCADGTVLETEYTVNVDKIKYPVDPVWGLLTNGSSKTWKWGADRCWCWGAYDGKPEEKAEHAGDWWGNTAEEIAGNCVGKDQDGGDATMTFVLVGTEIQKSCGSKGKFSFTMGEAEGRIGTFIASGAGILYPYMQVGDDVPHAAVSEYEILRINETHFDLKAAPADQRSPGGRCTFWHFVAAN